MAAAGPSACPAAPRPAGPFDASHRADRGGQDACRLFAEPDRIVAWPPQRDPGHPHTLYLAAEGARGRYRPQPRSARLGDEAADPHRNAHRRYASIAPRPSTPRPARHPADDARTDCLDAGLARGTHAVRIAEARHLRRAARDHALEARRSAGARSCAAPPALAQPCHDGPLRHGARSGRASALAGAAARRYVAAGLQSGTTRHRRAGGGRSA